MQPEPKPSKLKVVLVICFYIVAALVMIVVNKTVLNVAPKIPFSFLFIQLLIAVLILRFLALVSSTPLGRFLPAKFELPPLEIGIVVKLAPYLSVGFLGLVFNTLCLAHGLLLPLTVLVSSLATRMSPKRSVLLASAIVTAGFIVGMSPSFDHQNKTIIAREPFKALVYGCFSSLVLAIHTVISKIVTKHVTHSVFALSYWGNLLMSVMILPCIYFNDEVEELLWIMITPEEQDWGTLLLGSIVTGVVGTLLGIANVLSIKVTSPVAHMFTSASKSVIQTLLGVLIFKDIITIPRAYSITLITGGTAYYTWAQATSKPRARSPPSDIEKQGETEPLAVESEKD
ncbi:hypothetical protein FB45DRAFT_928270 [Roridomyces roridus]|uniref:GDP-mannose transporter n=1 Tax=Roridomyces roridus TaxID=1738132 RepID=A0AAD7FIM7_9AGAR|nr:hypothetical protein FB45DRAFT_928270 [Roridomyces roridus]